MHVKIMIFKVFIYTRIYIYALYIIFLLKKMTTLNLNEVYQFITNIVHKCGIIINDAYYKEKSVTEKGNFD